MRDYEVTRDGTVLTIVLGEELAVGNAPMLMEELTAYRDQGVEQVELMEGQWGVFFGAEAHTVSSLTFIAEAKKWLCAYFGIPEW